MSHQAQRCPDGPDRPCDVITENWNGTEPSCGPTPTSGLSLENEPWDAPWVPPLPPALRGAAHTRRAAHQTEAGSHPLCRLDRRALCSPSPEGLGSSFPSRGATVPACCPEDRGKEAHFQAHQPASESWPLPTQRRSGGEAPVSWGRGPGTAGRRGQGAAQPPRGLHTAQRSPAHSQAPCHFLSHQQTPWPTVNPREPEAPGANRQGGHGLGHRPLARRAGRGEPGAALRPPQDRTRAKPLSHPPQEHP